LELTRIAHLSTAHPRRELRVHLKQCNSLAAAGFEVYFVVADGYGDEAVDKVNVVDAGLPKGRIARFFYAPWKVFRKATALKASLYHFHDPELLPVGLVLKLRGAKVIYDSHEDVPRSVLSRDWIPARLRRIVSAVFERFENFIARRLDHVVGATPFIAERFRVAGCHAIAINNFPLPTEISYSPERSAEGDRICFLGSISQVRGVWEIVSALNQTATRLILAGPFDRAETRAKLESLPGWEHVDYLGVIDRDAALAAMGSAAVGMICYLPEPNHTQAYPNKLFEYMAAGLPVIASDFPLWRQIVTEADCGVCVDPTDSNQIANAITELLNNPARRLVMGRNGIRAVMSFYNWSTEEQKLIALYASTLTVPPPPGRHRATSRA
jgi:glycosyltransferase involved in cell wall biosynthesis